MRARSLSDNGRERAPHPEFTLRQRGRLTVRELLFDNLFLR